MLDSVTLKVPNGDVWQVDLIKSKGKLCFNNGWMEFAMHYGITFGNLLVFKYEGFSIFNVLIFDPTACEIVYPKKKCILGHKSTQVKTRKKLDSCKKIKFDDLKPCSSWDQDQNQVTEIKITGLSIFYTCLICTCVDSTSMKSFILECKDLNSSLTSYNQNIDLLA